MYSIYEEDDIGRGWYGEGGRIVVDTAGGYKEMSSMLADH
jgi:hypothetical protein